MTVDEILSQCREAEMAGRSRYFAMTYEQGVRAGIEWALGLTGDPPVDADEPCREPGRRKPGGRSIPAQLIHRRSRANLRT